MEKHKILMAMAVLIFVFALLPVQTGCDKDGDDNETTTTTTVEGDNPDSLSCVPCGDFDLTCPKCEITGCPYCMAASDGVLETVYTDGTYLISEDDGEGPDTATFYDSEGVQCFQVVEQENTLIYSGNTGEECYRAVTDYTAYTVTWTVDGAQYVNHTEDGSWDCPDGTTWVKDPACEKDDYEPSGLPEPPDSESCPPVTDVCSGEDLPM